MARGHVPEWGRALLTVAAFLGFALAWAGCERAVGPVDVDAAIEAGERVCDPQELVEIRLCESGEVVVVCEASFYGDVGCRSVLSFRRDDEAPTVTEEAL